MMRDLRGLLEDCVLLTLSAWWMYVQLCAGERGHSVQVGPVERRSVGQIGDVIAISSYGGVCGHVVNSFPHLLSDRYPKFPLGAYEILSKQTPHTTVDIDWRDIASCIP